MFINFLLGLFCTSLYERLKERTHLATIENYPPRTQNIYYYGDKNKLIHGTSFLNPLAFEFFWFRTFMKASKTQILHKKCYFLSPKWPKNVCFWHLIYLRSNYFFWNMQYYVAYKSTQKLASNSINKWIKAET